MATDFSALGIAIRRAVLMQPLPPFYMAGTNWTQDEARYLLAHMAPWCLSHERLLVEAQFPALVFAREYQTITILMHTDALPAVAKNTWWMKWYASFDFVQNTHHKPSSNAKLSRQDRMILALALNDHGYRLDGNNSAAKALAGIYSDLHLHIENIEPEEMSDQTVRNWLNDIRKKLHEPD